MASPEHEVVLDRRTKGMPGLAEPVPLHAIGTRGWNILAQDMPLPIAVLKESVLTENARWLADFAARSGVSFCPHGKTTMSPQLFRRQLESGAWGITLSTAHQVQVAREFGVQRIVLANQLVDPPFIDYVLAELDRDPEFTFFCLVDSLRGVEILRSRAAARGADRPIEVLVEVGLAGGRTGCRTMSEAMAVARAVADAGPRLALRGVEGFEGIVPVSAMADPTPIAGLLELMAQTAAACDAAGLFAEGEVILSAGGSAYFDLVSESLSRVSLGRPCRVVLRSGCYITHDSEMYRTYFAGIRERSGTARAVDGELRPALEVIAYVQSRPEPGLALLTAGRRDVSFDHSLPRALATFRPGEDRRPRTLDDDRHRIVALNDQHAFMHVPESSPLAVGDMVFMGISHPCTTFDKWDVLYGVDDDYGVVAAYKTYF